MVQDHKKIIPQLSLAIIQINIPESGDRFINEFFSLQSTEKIELEVRQDYQKSCSSIEQQERQGLNNSIWQQLVWNDDYEPKDTVYNQYKWRKRQQCLFDQIRAEKFLHEGCEVFKQFPNQFQMRQKDARGEQALAAERPKDLQLYIRLKQFQVQGKLEEQFSIFSQEMGYSGTQMSKDCNRSFKGSLSYFKRKIYGFIAIYKQDYRRKWLAIERGRTIWKKFQELRWKFGISRAQYNQYQRIYRASCRPENLLGNQ